MGAQNRETEWTGTEAIERKTLMETACLKTQHGRWEKNGWEKANKKEIMENELATA